MPDREANDALFRLGVSVLRRLQPGAVWMPLTYFDLWITRLTGLLPDLRACAVCGATLNGSRSFFHPLADGLMCADDKRVASQEMSRDSRSLAAKMFRAPVDEIAADWPKSRAADLRRFLVQLIERHTERKLVTATMLEKL
jgi:DNA repair protein RecO (recombination protein O)